MTYSFCISHSTICCEITWLVRGLSCISGQISYYNIYCGQMTLWILNTVLKDAQKGCLMDYLSIRNFQQQVWSVKIIKWLKKFLKQKAALVSASGIGRRICVKYVSIQTWRTPIVYMIDWENFKFWIWLYAFDMEH